MDKEEIFLAIDKILDEWDPTGIIDTWKPLPDSHYVKGMKGEYHEFIRPIIQIYVSNQSVYNFLVTVQEDISSNNEIMNEHIRTTAKQIVDYLSNYNLEDLRLLLSEEISN